MARRTKGAVWWRDQLQRRSASGMSRARYCAWHGLSRSTWYRWERRLRDQAVTLQAMAWIAVVVPDSTAVRVIALGSQAPC